MGKSIIIKTDELQYYLKDLKKIPVISHEREDEIFELLKNPNLPKRDELKKEVIIGNLRFVISQAKLYQNLSDKNTLEDSLIQWHQNEHQL